MNQVDRVWCDDPQGMRRCLDVSRSQGVHSIIENGLWVSSDFGECVVGLIPHGGNLIPPSRLVCITKLDLPEESSVSAGENHG